VRSVRAVRSNQIVRLVASFVLPEAIPDDLVHVARGLPRVSGFEVSPDGRFSWPSSPGITLSLENPKE